MKGQAFIDFLREPFDPDSRHPSDEEGILLADAVELADESCKSDIECGCAWLGQDADRWYDTRQALAEDQDHIGRAIHYLDRRGLIERKAGEPHLVRFVEEV